MNTSIELLTERDPSGLVSRLDNEDDDSSDNIFLTGVADIDKEILLNLDDKDLDNVCSTNKRAEKICNDDQFWNLRIQRSYGSDLSKYINGMKYKEIYKELIKLGYDINKVLIQASLLGYLPVVKYLIDSGANVNGTDSQYKSPLDSAAYGGHLSIVEYLIENEAMVNRSLGLAAKNGHLSVVTYLLENGASSHADKDEALTWASQHGQLSVVKYLIEYGVNIHSLNNQALRRAAEYGHLPVVKYLIEHEAYIHVWDDEALTSASLEGHLSVVKYLLEKGADIHAIDDICLQWVSLNEHFSVVAYLDNYINNHI